MFMQSKFMQGKDNIKTFFDSVDMGAIQIPFTFACSYLQYVDDVKRTIINDKKKTVVILWKNGDKTIAKASDKDKFDAKIGYALCVLRKWLLDKDIPKNRQKALLQSIDNKKYNDFIIEMYNIITFNDIVKTKKHLEKVIKEAK